MFQLLVDWLIRPSVDGLEPTNNPDRHAQLEQPGHGCVRVPDHPEQQCSGHLGPTTPEAGDPVSDPFHEVQVRPSPLVQNAVV